MRIIQDYLQGKKPLWKAYWLVGVGGSILFALLFYLVRENEKLFNAILLVFVVYLVWSSVSIWCCANNASQKLWKYLARAAIIWGIIGFLISMDPTNPNYIGPRKIDPAETIAKKYETKESQKAAKNARDDFYEKYPELNTPENIAIVRQAAATVAKERGKISWNAELRDEIAKRAKAIIAAKNTTQEKTEKSPPKNESSDGTGFIISPDGYVLTNSHVISGCKKLFATLGEDKQNSTIIANDENADLAVVKMKGKNYRHAIFRSDSVHAGEDIMVAGFPLKGLLSGMNITKGNVSAMVGLEGDKNYIQISAPLQPGNSGSPILDTSGNIVGMATESINSRSFVHRYDYIPQNINFAINGQFIKKFLETKNIPIQSEDSTTEFSASRIADKATDFTVLIECEM